MWVDICWIQRLSHKRSLQLQSRSFALPYLVWRDNYRRYDNAGAWIVWIDPIWWRNLLTVNENRFTNRIHIGSDPRLHCKTDPREKFATWHQAVVSRPSSLLLPILWQQICLVGEVRRAARWQQSRVDKPYKNAERHWFTSHSECTLFSSNSRRAQSMLLYF